ncbi:Amidophosphoribosyltransferase [uncultured delta proteobacterium]|uniref:Amidophosphoribosyltransferase n=1 Tax=uncultured delta proteobacterium TaxID=34034 RepID=A0A212KBM9_9DELT|nr:Amidophosphoribosyltransferase [uncultured delta proteobacterium]
MGGIFGIAQKGECVSELFYGTDYLSHLGTKRGGMAVAGPAGFNWKIHRLESSYFRTKLEPSLRSFSGNLGLGAISDTDAQPLTFTSHLGRFSVASVGKITNSAELAQKANESHCFFSGASDGHVRPTEIIAMLLSAEKTFEDGIRAVHEQVKGSCTFAIMTPKGIYACRDKLGRTPLALGKSPDGYALSSESSAFLNLGYTPLRDLGPGEAVFITPDGVETRIAPGDTMQICSFLWVYYGYPSSDYEGVNVEAFRYRCGACLGQEDDVEADFAGGIPDSGIGHAVGYANSRHLPYQRPIVKYTPTWPRSFMPQNQESRDLVAKMKLIPNRTLIEGKSMVFLDDSIVRGTQLRDNAKILYQYGAKAVHMRIACPVLVYPCEFLNFSSSRSALELIGLKAIAALEGGTVKDIQRYVDANDPKNAAMVEWIRNKLDLSSLKFQKMDNMVKAVGLPKEKLCTHCWDGSSYGI